MIRVLIGSVLPILGLAMAAAFAGPGLVAGPRGEPLLVAAPGADEFQLTRFSDEACATAELLADRPAAEAGGAPFTSILALRYGPDGIAVAMQEVAPGAGTGGATLILVFDEAGRLLAAGNSSTLMLDAAAAALTDECLSADPAGGGPI